MTKDEAYEIMLGLAALPHFPMEQAAHVVIATQLAAMCETAEQAAWLVNRAVQLWTKWESVRDLRAILCARYKPKDGFDVNYSGAFHDGIVPSEKPQPEQKALPDARSRTVTADAKLQQAVIEAAQRKRLSPPPLPSRAERQAEQEFNRILDEVETGQQDREQIKPPRHKRQSEIWALSKDEPSLPAAPGSYAPVTYEDVRRAVSDLRARNEEES